MTTKSSGAIYYYPADGGAVIRTVTAEDVVTMEAELKRLEKMEYALEAGNTAREDVPADVLKRWFSYVHTGNEATEGKQ